MSAQANCWQRSGRNVVEVEELRRLRDTLERDLGCTSENTTDACTEARRDLDARMAALKENWKKQAEECSIRPEYQKSFDELAGRK